MNNLLDSFASAMRSARIKRGLTQRALAERLNMSVRTIIEIENMRSEVFRKYSGEVVAKQYLNLYQNLIRRKVTQ